VTELSEKLENAKPVLESIPVIGPFLVHLLARQDDFKSSSDYWDRRYRTGGNSGPGSYKRLAEFKANFLNRFVDQYQIASVIEYGSGDGAQVKLARYPSYTGVDISPKAVEMCRILFSGDTSKRFLQWDAVVPDSMADLSLSLDASISWRIPCSTPTCGGCLNLLGAS
jgi:hypothetical protein